MGVFLRPDIPSSGDLDSFIAYKTIFQGYYNVGFGVKIYSLVGDCS